MVRRFPVVTSVVAGLVAGLLGAAALALAGFDNEGGGLPRLPVAGAGRTELASDARAAIAPAGPIEYRVEGDLADLPDEAPAYELEEDGEGRVEALKDALAIDGDVRREEEAWVVRDGDRVLRVASVPGLPWSFGDEGGRVTGAPGDVALRCLMPPCPPGQACIQVCEEEPAAPQPDAGPRADAERAADALFGRLGIDVGGKRVTRGFDGWDVTARAEVGELPVVGLETVVTFGSGGELIRASGHLADPQRLGDYPLVSTEAALARLRQGFHLGPQVLMGREPALDAPLLPPDVAAAQAITGVRLGLLFVPGGSEAFLVPAALFRLDRGDEIPVPAVTDQHLVDVQPAPSPEPDPGGFPEPAPLPVEPGGGTGGGVGGSAGLSCSGAASASATGGESGAPAEQATLELCGPGRAAAGEEVAFEVSVAPCEGLLDFGDGSTAPVAPGDRTTVAHAYQKPGTYDVTLSAPACGPGGNLTHQVTVS